MKGISRRELVVKAAGLIAGGSMLSHRAMGMTLLDRLTGSVQMTLQNNGKYKIFMDGIPSHPVGDFVMLSDPKAQPRSFEILAKPPTPAPNAPVIPLNGWLFGFLFSNTLLDPSGPWWRQDPTTGWSIDPICNLVKSHFEFDFNNAHTQFGEYHCHGRPLKYIETLVQAPAMRLLGYAADGHPIYDNIGYSDPRDPSSPLKTLRSSYRRLSGPRPSGGPKGEHDQGAFDQDFEYVAGLGDLDECNGRFGITPEFPAGTYYYVLTDDYPRVPRFWRSQANPPDPSFYHPEPGTVAFVPPQVAALFE